MLTYNAHFPSANTINNQRMQKETGRIQRTIGESGEGTQNQADRKIRVHSFFDPSTGAQIEQNERHTA